MRHLCTQPRPSKRFQLPSQYWRIITPPLPPSSHPPPTLLPPSSLLPPPSSLLPPSLTSSPFEVKIQQSYNLSDKIYFVVCSVQGPRFIRSVLSTGQCKSCPVVREAVGLCARCFATAPRLQFSGYSAQPGNTAAVCGASSACVCSRTEGSYWSRLRPDVLIGRVQTNGTGCHFYSAFAESGPSLKYRRFFYFWGVEMVIGWICSRHLFEISWEGLHDVLPIFIAEESRMF